MSMGIDLEKYRLTCFGLICCWLGLMFISFQHLKPIYPVATLLSGMGLTVFATAESCQTRKDTLSGSVCLFTVTEGMRWTRNFKLDGVRVGWTPGWHLYSPVLREMRGLEESGLGYPLMPYAFLLQVSHNVTSQEVYKSYKNNMQKPLKFDSHDRVSLTKGKLPYTRSKAKSPSFLRHFDESNPKKN